MYQQAIRRFAHFSAIQLSEPAPIPELLIMALKDEDLESTDDNDMDLKNKIAEVIIILLHMFPSWANFLYYYQSVSFYLHKPMYGWIKFS